MLKIRLPGASKKSTPSSSRFGTLYTMDDAMGGVFEGARGVLFQDMKTPPSCSKVEGRRTEEEVSGGGKVGCGESFAVQ